MTRRHIEKSRHMGRPCGRSNLTTGPL